MLLQGYESPSHVDLQEKAANNPLHIVCEQTVRGSQLEEVNLAAQLLLCL